MKKISEKINRYVEYITAVLLFIMVVIISLQVFCRHVLDNSLSWSEEVSRYLFIWITLLAISVGVKRGFLVSIDFLVDKLKGASKKTIEIICSLLILAFSLVMMVYGYEIATKVASQLSPALRISMTYVYFSIPVSGALIFVHVISIITSQIFQFTIKKSS